MTYLVLFVNMILLKLYYIFILRFSFTLNNTNSNLIYANQYIPKGNRIPTALNACK